MQVALRVEKSLVTAASMRHKEETERMIREQEREDKRHMVEVRVSPHEHLLVKQEKTE